MAEGEGAIVVGVGPGLGTALARRFARDRMSVVVTVRSSATLEPLVKDLSAVSGRGFAYGCGATDEQAVGRLFAQVESDHGGPQLVVFNAGAFVRRGMLD